MPDLVEELSDQDILGMQMVSRTESTLLEIALSRSTVMRVRIDCARIFAILQRLHRRRVA